MSCAATARARSSAATVAMFNTTSTTSTPGRTSIARGNSGDDRAPDAHERRPAARLGGRAPCQQGEAQADRQAHGSRRRSEEHTSELQSLMRSSYAVFCLKKKKSIVYTQQTE